MFRKLLKLRMFHNAGCMLGILLAAPLVLAAPTPQEATEFFESKIRPVLVEKCYSCHSATAKKIKGDFTVDSAAGILKGGESGAPAVVPQHPEKSKLLDAIEYKSDDLQMPPKERLPAEVVANFQTWIAMGAPDPRTGSAGLADSHLDIAAAKKHWWAFIPPQEHPLPPVKEPGLVKTPIDQFILARLESKGLSFSPPADKRTLIRRATFDLIGLPPTTREIADFEADQSSDAFEKVVDRLLASPQYGERWGRYWLDIARYADTKGYVFQEDRRYPFAYTYRDWVVNAFNTDLPYNQFIIDQLAADRLDLGSDKHPLAAMGFLTVGRRFLNAQVDIIDDRIDVVCRGMLAMTVGCARCHDHKFDPIPTKDYYSLYGIFANSTEPADLPEISKAPNTPAHAAFEAKLAAAKAKVQEFRSRRLTEIVFNLRTAPSIADHLMAVAESISGPGTQKSAAVKYNTRGILVARWQTYVQLKKSDDAIWSAWKQLSTLPDAQIGSQITAAAKKTTNPLIQTALLTGAPKSLRELADCYSQVIAHYAAVAPWTDKDQEALRQILMAKDGPVSLTDADLDKALNQADRLKLAAYRKKVDELTATDPNATARAMVMVDLPQMSPSNVFKRGNPANPGDAVPRAFLSVLSPDPRPNFDKDSGRLEMAEAIASDKNPLTARVIVNRIWGHHFGQAIVRTPSDFGHRGEMPSHPELLDYLALQFEHSGWSIKKMQKLIMMSAVYQQGSDDNNAKRLIDPENVLLWKFNRQRLDFEAMRDSLLAVSGQLDARMGGQSVDIFAEPFSTRRSIYGSIDRQNLPSVLRAFDFASPDSHSPQRYFTTVPQQALFMMNSPFVMDAAKSVMNREPIAQTSDPQRRIELLYQTVLDRNPTDDEMVMGLAFIQSQASVATTPPPPTPTWLYGYGEYDSETEHAKTFHAFTHFAKGIWQSAAEVPNSISGFAMLTATGGHPGNDMAHAVIRRWTAPRDGVVSIRGTLAHGGTQGDGVRGRIVSSHDGLIGEWIAQNSSAATPMGDLVVQAGDTVDFIVDCRANDDSDSFSWAPLLTLSGPKPGSFNAVADFSGKDQASPDTTYNAWDKYAQVLLETNEFVFVD